MEPPFSRGVDPIIRPLLGEPGGGCFNANCKRTVRHGSALDWPPGDGVPTSRVCMLPPVRERRRDAVLVFAVALAARLVVVAWAHSRFPAAEDGHYYDVLARRLASGAGFTWLWPDGAVTYVAHYPVGYPAILAAAYAVFGGSNGTAMTMNALLGAIGACCAHRVADGPGTPRWLPLAAGLCVALHPALVPYTAAVMTEGVTASLLLVAAAAVASAHRSSTTPGTWRPAWGWVAAIGITMGLATLVRPQCLALAPVFGALAAQPPAGWRSRLARAAATSAIALACVAPWTARNCVHMHRCALVSVNGGWNLLIGATSTTGSWQPIDVPAGCATVWDEAAKDTCFEQAARRDIARDPAAWFLRAPAKLAATFDYFGAAPWYLHSSNPLSFVDGAKTALGALETVWCRLVLLMALGACARLDGAARLVWVRRLVLLAGAVGAVTVHGWIGYVAICLAVPLLGWRALARGPVIVPCAAAVIAATACVHAAFFGGGRYGLVAAPFVAILAMAVLVVPGPAVARRPSKVQD